MASLLSQYGAKKIQKGEIVEGTVIEITPKSMSVDIGAKGEGLVVEGTFAEAKEYIKGLKLGDRVRAKVLIPETPEGYVILSLRESVQGHVWDKLESALDEEKEINSQVKNASGSGILVDVMGVNGFIPTSQLGKKVSKDPQKLIGTLLKVRIIEVDRRARRVVLSEKYVSEKKEMEAAVAAMTAIKVGETYKGIVTTVTDFGCFVEIQIPNSDAKLEGLVHVSELSWDKVAKPSEYYSQGDKVEVVVLAKEGKKLSLSIKQTENDPWGNIEEKYAKDTKHTGQVTRVSDFGVFVHLEHGVEGLIHITKVPPGQKLEEGKDVNVYVEDVDSKAKKISLGLVLTAKPVGYK